MRTGGLKRAIVIATPTRRLRISSMSRSFRFWVAAMTTGNG